MRFYSILIIFLPFLSGCRDLPGSDIGDASISGRLLLQIDPFELIAAQPAAEKSVTLSYASVNMDTSDHLFSTTTDTEGYFTFPYLREGKEYTLRYEEVIEGKVYYGGATTQSGNESQELQAKLARLSQTGLILLAGTEQDGPLTGVKHCLFREERLATGTDDECVGSAYQLTSDPNGNTGAFGIADGTYFVRSSIQLPSGVHRDTTRVEVPAGQIVNYRIKLRY